MIYHTNKHPLDWEKGNMEYGESRGLGKRFLLSDHPNFNDSFSFTDLLSETFALRKSMRTGKAPVPEANIDFASNLRKTVQAMVSPKTKPSAEK